MKDTQILSAFQELNSVPAAAEPQRALVFDACQMGVMLRAVLFVEAAVAVVAMFFVQGFLDWVVRLALVTGGALPATLAWLLAACAAKRWLARATLPVQYFLAVALGALAGVYGCALLWISGLVTNAPWIGCASAGTLLSAVLVAALVMRAKGRTPANTAARLEELQARIRPHFLFNTLNSAIALVRAEPAKAETLLEDLSDLFRHALIDQGVGHAGRRSGSGRATLILSRCVLATGCGCMGTDPKAKVPCCRRCCCSRWWKTLCAMGLSPVRAAQT